MKQCLGVKIIGGLIWISSVIMIGSVSADTFIYNDSLASNWDNWSWSTSLNFSATDQVYEGQFSVSVEHTEAWAGVYLHTDNFLNSSDFANLSFMIHGGVSGNHPLIVYLYDGNLNPGPGLIITSQPDIWTEISIPLSDLGNPVTISGIVIQNNSENSQPVYYLDSISFDSVSGTPTPTPTPGNGPSLAVFAQSQHHQISSYIYGLNFADDTLAQELDLPVNRWGGNATTRYNWQADTSNRGSDWFYENIPNSNDHPELLPHGSASDLFHETNILTNTATLMTIPMIGWTPRARAFDCGFRVSLYGPQESVDPWAPDCGNGNQTTGDPITGNNPADTSQPVDELFVQDWLIHLTAKYGSASSGGIRFYDLDNEPMLWNSTHRDVRPDPLSYDEIRDRIITYGSAIKAIDPESETLGPVTWGWTAYFYSALDWSAGGSWWIDPLDRNAHGGTAFTPWLLNELHQHELNTGVRILDYLDLHYYPQAPGVTLASAGNQATQELRLRSTRSLWDGDYVDESWINEPVALLQRMTEWIESNYPGTKRALTEYNFGGLEHINGAVTQAEVLGVFGRENLDLACLWSPPESSEPGAFAFRMYRNYDQAGGQFGSISVETSSSDHDSVSIFASLNTSQTVLTVMIINKSFSTLLTDIGIHEFTAASTAHCYLYSDADLSQITRLPDVSIVDSHADLILPAQSITLLVIDGENCHHDGDVNNDGNLTAADAQMTFEIVLGLYAPSTEEFCSSDCNNDGNITAEDAQTIFLAVLGSGSCVDEIRF